MFPSPKALRSGSKAQASIDKAAAGDKRPAVPVNQRSNSAPSASSSKGGSDTVMGGGAAREKFSAFLSDDEFLNRLADKVADNLFDRLADTISARFIQAFEPRLSALEARVESLAAEVVAVREDARARQVLLENKIDDQEQYQRRNNVRIFGVEEVRGEDVTAIVTEICHDKLNVNIDPALIDRCHRSGRVVDPRPGEPRPRPRPILVKFISYQTKRAVLSVRRQLKGSSITIREDLTRKRNSFYREVAARVGQANAWTVDGTVKWREGDRIMFRRNF